MSLWDLAEAITGKNRDEIKEELRSKAGAFVARVTPKCERCGCLLLYHASGIGPCAAKLGHDDRKCECPGYVNSPRPPQTPPPNAP